VVMTATDLAELVEATATAPAVNKEVIHLEETATVPVAVVVAITSPLEVLEITDQAIRAEIQDSAAETNRARTRTVPELQVDEEVTLADSAVTQEPATHHQEATVARLAAIPMAREEILALIHMVQVPQVAVAEPLADSEATQELEIPHQEIMAPATLAAILMDREETQPHPVATVATLDQIPTDLVTQAATRMDPVTNRQVERTTPLLAS